MSIFDKLGQDLAGIRMVDPGAVPGLPPEQMPMADPDGYAQAMSSIAPEAIESPVVDPMAIPAPMVPEARPAITEQPVASGSMPAMESASMSTPMAVPQYTASDKASLDAISTGNLAAGVTDQQSMLADAQAIAGQKTADAQALAGVDEAMAAEETGLIDQYMLDQEEAHADAGNKIGAIDEEIRQLASREPDPGRFWDTRTDGQKALYFITMALQAFSNPTEVPAVSETLMKFIDRDIGMQEKRMESEMGAAQGRAKSVRELIMMGKEKDDAVYAARQSRLASLYKMNTAQIKASQAGTKAQEELLGTRSIIAKTMADLYKTRFDQKADISKLAIEQSRLALARRAQAHQEDQDKKKAEVKADVPVVRIEGVANGVSTGVGPDGKPLRNGIVLNKALGDDGVKLVTDTVRKHSAASQLFAKLYTVVDRIEREGSSPALDKELSDLLVSSAGQMAKMGGDTGALSNQDMIRNMSPFGRISLDSNGGLTGIELYKSAKTNPESIRKFLDFADERLRVGADSMLSTASDTEYPAPKIESGKDLYDRQRTERQKAEGLESGARVKEYAAGPQASGLDSSSEAATRAVSGGLFLPKDELDIATQSIAAKGREGSGVKTRDQFVSEVISAKEQLRAEKATATSQGEKMRIDSRIEKLEAIEKVSELTPEGMSPKAYLAGVKEKLGRINLVGFSSPFDKPTTKSDLEKQVSIFEKAGIR